MERALMAAWQALPGWVQWLAGLAVAAALARLAWHGDQVRQRKRDCLSWLLLYELLTALALAIVGGGVGDYFDLRPLVTAGVTVLLAWFGFTGVQVLFVRALQKRGLLPAEPPVNPTGVNPQKDKSHV
jgi:hypothetical protein